MKRGRKPSIKLRKSVRARRYRSATRNPKQRAAKTGIKLFRRRRA